MTPPQTRYITLAAGLFLALAGTGLAGGASPDAARLTMLDATPDTTLLHFDMPEWGFNTVKVDGKDWVVPVVPGAKSSKSHPGQPDLPVVTRSLAIPPDAHMQVVVSDVSYSILDGIEVAPDRGAISRSADPESIPYTFGDAYQKNDFWPAEPAKLGMPWLMRSARGIDLCVQPFQYNPITKQLRVIDEMVIKVVQDGPGQYNVLDESYLRSDRLGFRELYLDTFINWEVVYRPVRVPRTIEMLVIAPEAWLPDVQPLVDHRNDEGIVTISKSIESIGNTEEDIKTHIESRWSVGDLSYVLFVGDIEQITSPTIVHMGDTGATDPTYGHLRGEDTRPEVFVGRFPARTKAEAQLMVERTIQYEKQMVPMHSYRHRALGIGSDDEVVGVQPDDDELDWVHLNNIRDLLLAGTYTDVAQVYAPACVNADTVDAIENGVNFINYTGHGSQNAWATSTFSSANVDALENASMWPWICSVACDVGRFNDGDCLGESWLRATGDGDTITGAVAAFMSTINQDWAPPMEAQDVIGAKEAAGKINRMGPRCAAGTNSMVAAYPADGPRNAQTWNLLGDPALQLRAPKLEVKPIEWSSWSLAPGVDPLLPQWIQVGNYDDISRDIRFLHECDWLTITPIEVQLAPGESALIKVVVDETALAELADGAYHASIVLHDLATDQADQGVVARSEVSSACAGDLDQSGAIDISDLLSLISQWGACSDACAGDLDQNGVVDLDDLLACLSAFGPC